jgi:hypothetical protein
MESRWNSIAVGEESRLRRLLSMRRPEPVKSERPQAGAEGATTLRALEDGYIFPNTL